MLTVRSLCHAGRCEAAVLETKEAAAPLPFSPMSPPLTNSFPQGGFDQPGRPHDAEHEASCRSRVIDAPVHTFATQVPLSTLAAVSNVTAPATSKTKHSR